MSIAVSAAEISGEPFDREEPSQLVNLDSYRPYLIDPPEIVPIRPLTGPGSKYVHQHIYFTEPKYLNIRAESGEIDLRYRRLRTLSWSQIVMRRSEEQRLHREKEPTVKPPPEETVEELLKDYFDMDIVGATTLGIQELKKPKPFDPWASRLFAPPEVEALSKAGKIDILGAERDRALEDLNSPRVVSHMLVTSAFKRLASFLGDFTLEKIANERLQEQTHFPLRVPQYGALRTIGHHVILNGVKVRSLEESRLLIQGLQTEVDRVQL